MDRIDEPRCLDVFTNERWLATVAANMDFPIARRSYQEEGFQGKRAGILGTPFLRMDLEELRWGW